MRKMFLAIILILLSFPAVFAQEEKMSAGFGLEFNMNSRHNFAGGAALNFEYRLNYHAALGIILSASNNFFGITVLEPTAFIRGYIWENCHGLLFFQVDFGPFFILEEGDVIVLPELGLRAGFRKPLGKSYYIEPFGRLGYPFAFGVGVVAGKRF